MSIRPGGTAAAKIASEQGWMKSPGSQRDGADQKSLTAEKDGSIRRSPDRGRQTAVWRHFRVKSIEDNKFNGRNPNVKLKNITLAAVNSPPLVIKGPL